MSAIRRSLGGLVVWTSSALEAADIPHAFTTRHGGVSEAPFDTLNLGLATGDEREAVACNRQRLCAAFGLPSAALRFVKQVHGAGVVAAEEAGPWSDQDEPVIEADGLVGAAPGLLLGVRVADCLPVLIASPRTGAAAALHAGWRGLVAGVLLAGVQQLCERSGSSPRELVAAVGPAIGPDRYEVAEDVAVRFAERHRLATQPGRYRLDLAAEAEAQLRAAGVGTVDVLRLCTFESPEDFYSHRRDGGRTGRQAGVIVTRGVNGRPGR